MKLYFIHCWNHITRNWFIYFYTTEKGQSSRKCHWNAGNNEQKDQFFDWATYSRRPSEYKQPGDVVERSCWCLGQWRNIQLQSKNCKSFREDWYPNINCHMGYEKKFVVDFILACIVQAFIYSVWCKNSNLVIILFFSGLGGGGDVAQCPCYLIILFII